MAKFFIEVEHEATAEACARAIKLFMETGAHFLTHAEWGCKDDVHKAWVFVELDSKDEALHVLPPVYRSVAQIVQVYEFKMEDADAILREHETSETA